MGKKILFALLLMGSPWMVFASSEGEIFVRWRSGTSARHAELARQLGLKKVWSSTFVRGLERYERKDRKVNVLEILSDSPMVIYAEPNYVTRRVIPNLKNLEPLSLAFSSAISGIFNGLIPNDPRLPEQWALTTQFGVNPSGAWEITRGSKDIKVAVIDTGVDTAHPDLAGRFLPGYDFIAGSPEIIDGHGHGTHVSGIIGAVTNNGEGVSGINHEVSIIPIRAIPSNADETDANVIAAFEFAAHSGARVVNCSFGKREASQAVADTIEAVGERGLLVVVAAGNYGQDNNRYPLFPANFRSPNMIVVASIAESGGLSFFSNYGLGKVDIGAPGSTILSTLPGNKYAAWSGTSMAAPQVSGVAALALSANPLMSVAQLKGVILGSVLKTGSLIGKIDTGGRVDASAAVNAAHNLLLNAENP